MKRQEEQEKEHGQRPSKILVTRAGCGFGRRGPWLHLLLFFGERTQAGEKEEPMNADILLDFKSKLLGLYDNQTQAFTYPALWAQICVLFEENEDGTLLSKSWYKVESSDKPYRSSVLELYTSDNNVVMIPYNNITNTKSCGI